MKRIYSITMVAALVVALVSCSNDEPSAEEQFLTRLSFAWSVDNVTLDGQDVTSEFEDMVITFKKDKTYTVQNSVGNIWNTSGMFTAAANTDGLFDLTRNDDVEVTLSELSSTTLIFSMQFDSAPGERTTGLAGEYVFEMKR